MAATKDKKYFVVRDNNGDKYLCSLNAVKDRVQIIEDELEDCVESGIVERYSGNIDIESLSRT
jgi:hypothetical protein